GADAARGTGQALHSSRLHRVSRGWQEIQVAQAPPAHAIQHDAGAIPREVGLAARLSHGGTELRGRALASRQADGTGPAAPPQALIGSGQNLPTPFGEL